MIVMRGNVTRYDALSNQGVVCGQDGHDYRFVTAHWNAPTKPRRGSAVEFIPEGSAATELYPVGVSGAALTILPLLICCVFLGNFGLHRFLAGKILTGLLMLVTFGGFGLWVVYDFIVLVLGRFRDSQGRRIQAWT